MKKIILILGILIIQGCSWHEIVEYCREDYQRNQTDFTTTSWENGEATQVKWKNIEGEIIPIEINTIRKKK